MTDQSNPSNPEIPQAISAVVGVHVMAIEWLCKQLSDETGGTPMQWKVSAFTHGVETFKEMSPNALKAITDETLTMTQEAFNS